MIETSHVEVRPSSFTTSSASTDYSNTRGTASSESKEKLDKTIMLFKQTWIYLKVLPDTHWQLMVFLILFFILFLCFYFFLPPVIRRSFQRRVWQLTVKTCPSDAASLNFYSTVWVHSVIKVRTLSSHIPSLMVHLHYFVDVTCLAYLR